MLKISEGKPIELTGMITKAFNRGGLWVYALSDGKIDMDVATARSFEIGALVKVSGVAATWRGRLLVEAKTIERLSGEKATEMRAVIGKNVESSITIEDRPLLVENEVMVALKDKIVKIAKMMLAAKRLGRFVIIRFHGDADGISGGLALSSMLKANTYQQHSAFYTVNDAIRDLNLAQYQFQPLVILVDFGSNRESIDGLKLLKAGGIEVIIIDHHPFDENVKKLVSAFVNPWEVKKNMDASSYTAGYIAAEVARAAGYDVDALARTACAGDRSNIMKLEKADEERALVFDYAATYTQFGGNLDFYNTILKNQEVYYSLLQQAKEKLGAIEDSIMKATRKRTFGELNVYIVELDRIARKHEFPSRGKITTKVFDMVENDRPVMVVGYSERSVIFRLNDPATAKGIRADEIIKESMITMKDFIENGGGHAKAAALRVKKGFSKDIVEQVLKNIEKRAG